MFFSSKHGPLISRRISKNQNVILISILFSLPMKLANYIVSSLSMKGIWPICLKHILNGEGGGQIIEGLSNYTVAYPYSKYLD